MLNQTLKTGLHDRGRQTTERLRFQLPFGVLLAIVLPLVLVYLTTGLERVELQLRNSAIAAGAAFLIGLLLTRRMRNFAGIHRVETELPIFAITFGVAMVALLVLRVPYSNLFLLTSTGLTLAGFFMIATKLSFARRQLFMVVPVGNVERLYRVAQADFVSLDRLVLPAASSTSGIVADLRADLPDEWERILADAALRGIPVYHVKQIEEALTGRVDIEHLSENSLGSLLPSQAFVDLKNTLDRLVAVLLLPLLIVPMTLAMVAIRLDSPGPTLFRQRRMGRSGVPFTVFKFRSMTHNHAREFEREAAQTAEDDGRITPVGAFLRRYRIDELPQILNVLRGEMSWIGPRPEALVLSEWYDAELPFYKYRHIVKPGLTGWAQVNQGHVSDLNSVHDKLRYDFYYIKHFSLWLDLFIVVRTIKVLLGGYGVR